MRLEEMLGEVPSVVIALFEPMGWAEDEIESAQQRHGEQGRGPIYRRGFPEVKQLDLIDSEMLFRAHCREILDRIATGRDTRPGTDAELIRVLREASLRAPMTPGVDCLYFRLFARTFPVYAPTILGPIDLAAYESVHGSAADDHERRLRARLARDRTEE
jgi:hypothetical protein